MLSPNSTDCRKIGNFLSLHYLYRDSPWGISTFIGFSVALGGIGLSGDGPREGSPLFRMGVRLEILRLTAMVRGQTGVTGVTSFVIVPT